MQTTEIIVILGLVLQFFAFAAVMIGVLRRIATKADLQCLEDRFDTQDAKFDKRFSEQDTKLDRHRLEIKSDIQRVEDRSAEANEFHVKSVALLDGILRQLQERREPL